MEAITKYKANDGSEWSTKKLAIEREILIVEAAAALSPLKPKPDSIEFSNGHGYIQQDAAAIQRAKENLYRLSHREGILKRWIDGQKNDHGKTDADLIDCHPSWFCRMLDGDYGPLDQAYNRLCCIDDTCREWGQMYYAINPDKGDQVEFTEANNA